jgi:peptidylprolyl isomerase
MEQRQHSKSVVTLTLATLVAAGLAVHVRAQQTNKIVPPADVAMPPADADKTPSGLITKVVTPGPGGQKPLANDVVTLHYTGWTSSGEVVDSSVARGKPATFPLDKTLPGWQECVRLMVLSEKRRCWIPEKLAYAGAKGKPKGTIVFDIELIDTHPSPLIPPPDVAAPPEDARKTPSGLAYKVLRLGTGVRNPGANDRVLVHYTGWTTNGKMFDSSIPRGEAMRLSLAEVIPGWAEGLSLMVAGERTRLWIPQDLAYKGQAGAPRGMLVFDVELVGIE